MAPERITIQQNSRTQTQTVAFFSAMLKKYLIGQPVNADDHAALSELIQRHPKAPEKIGAGIDHFRIVSGGRMGNRGFEIVRTDGTTVTFSYVLAIAPHTASHDKEVLWAMRCEVQDQTRAFFDAAFARSAVFCEISGAKIDRKNAHVDHIRPMTFQRLVKGFLETKGIKLGDVQTVTVSGAVSNLADRELAAAWQEYHRDHAKLRITSKPANLRQRKPKVDFQPTPKLF